MSDEYTMIITIGEESKPIFEGIRSCNKTIKEIIMLASNKTLSKAEDYKDELKSLYKSKIIVINPSSLDSIINELISLYKKINHKKVIYNITSGTKIMSLACFIMALFNNNEIIYVFREDNNEMKVIDLPLIKINVDSFINDNKKAVEILKELNNKELTVKELSDKFKLKTQTIWGHLNKLSNKGLIKRVLENKRTYKIGITNTGKIMLKIKEMNNLD